MNLPSRTHLVLIPSYNTGPMVLETVSAALRVWQPVWVIVDGSNDGSDAALSELAKREPGLQVIRLPHNQGKGAAVLAGLESAQAEGFTHALTLDADGQHPTHLIPDFMQASREQPEAMILGLPVFDASAPALRVQGRRVSNTFANLETLYSGIGDSLCGFRVYPIAPLVEIMRRQRWMRRFDFDPEAAVRLRWRGVPVINRSAPVRYLKREEGGVSHFHYGRDNTLLTWMHVRLLLGFFIRLPWLTLRRLRGLA